MKRFYLFFLITVLIICVFLFNRTNINYKTENVIIVVIDGPRYTETWGDPEHKHIPNFSKIISQHGIINERFFNNGKTSTVSGYTAITTGHYERVLNNGKVNPTYPSIFQYYNKSNHIDTSYIVLSKHKLKALGNCKIESWKGKYLPITDCGTYDFKPTNRDDSLTLIKFLNILINKQPKLSMIGFMEPDISGHNNDWNGYLQGIKDTDRYLLQIWEFISTHPKYKDKTTLFVTNDHGRHSGHFKKHGDKCLGCKHVVFFAYGPDFKKGIINKQRELIDISATILELLQIKSDNLNGKIMRELFK